MKIFFFICQLRITMNLLDLPFDILDLVYENLDEEKYKSKFMISYLGSNNNKNKTNSWIIPRKLFNYFGSCFEKNNIEYTHNYLKNLNQNEKIETLSDLGILLFDIHPKPRYKNNIARMKDQFWLNELNIIKQMKTKLSTDPINLKKNKIIFYKSKDLIHSLPLCHLKKAQKSLTLRSILPLAKLNLEKI